ncbi:MAG: GAF domain-containing protein, partial [Ginsengibacter sp.]
AIIRQKCTAIHASVAWRFVEAAEKLLESRMYSDEDKMEDIVFPGVYPLYGQSDIKGSSLVRNLSIQEDLITQLSLAKNILGLTVQKFPLPVYKDLRYRVDNYIQQLREQLTAGDENVVQEFLKEEVDPVFTHLHTLHPDIHAALQDYESRLDPLIGMLYEKRKDYELSVKLINEYISEYFDKAEVAAQNMFPHYFEKYKSDGVEHNLYVGQSMVNNNTFHPLYLQNLRLWQLMITCEVENEIFRIKPHLKTRLDICSLILVHSQPLSIRFRMEEKKFDVDGAYNARYEIIKKRIDKAIVKETGERLTQPGKIAIIYSSEKEAKEYLNYIHYLQFINYISADVEWLTLKDLQGMTGLKALRISIMYDRSGGGKTESKAIELLKEISHN